MARIRMADDFPAAVLLLLVTTTSSSSSSSSTTVSLIKYTRRTLLRPSSWQPSDSNSVADVKSAFLCGSMCSVSASCNAFTHDADSGACQMMDLADADLVDVDDPDVADWRMHIDEKFLLASATTTTTTTTTTTAAAPAPAPAPATTTTQAAAEGEPEATTTTTTSPAPGGEPATSAPAGPSLPTPLTTPCSGTHSVDKVEFSFEQSSPLDGSRIASAYVELVFGSPAGCDYDFEYEYDYYDDAGALQIFDDGYFGCADITTNNEVDVRRFYSIGFHPSSEHIIFQPRRITFTPSAGVGYTVNLFAGDNLQSGQ